ncbi:hypothetical protein V5O48_003678 [Marasmius crinis-equi]|uniref:Uncharacterized protein n=1 Tax=Marasmius crinis-equi TaxID=585013 RepID=A0ABR3FS77_9AGAR
MSSSSANSVSPSLATLSAPWPSPTWTRGSGGGWGGNGDGRGRRDRDRDEFASSLYLWTFLSVLILLVIISTIVIFRARTLRQRHRRLVEEAIRTGTYVPPRKNPGFKWISTPVLWEARVQKASEGRNSVRWQDIKPISADLRSSHIIQQRTSLPSASNLSSVSRGRWGFFKLPFGFFRSASSPISARSPSGLDATNLALPVQTLTSEVEAQPSLLTVQYPSPAVGVLVFISMPTPSKAEEVFRPMEIGAVDIDLDLRKASDVSGSEGTLDGRK